jgi:hypothetical protein
MVIGHDDRRQFLGAGSPQRRPAGLAAVGYDRPETGVGQDPGRWGRAPVSMTSARPRRRAGWLAGGVGFAGTVKKGAAALRALDPHPPAHQVHQPLAMASPRPVPRSGDSSSCPG